MPRAKTNLFLLELRIFSPDKFRTSTGFELLVLRSRLAHLIAVPLARKTAFFHSWCQGLMRSGGPCIHPPQEFGGSDGEVGRFAKLAADPSTRTIKLGGGLFRGKNRTVRKRIFICERQRRRGGEMSFWDGAGFPPISLRQLDCPNRPRERGQVHLPFCDDAFLTGDSI